MNDSAVDAPAVDAPDNAESARVQPAFKQEAQGQPAQTNDRYIMLQLCLPLGEGVSNNSNALIKLPLN